MGQILDVVITGIQTSLGRQIYELFFNGSRDVKENFASFAWLNFGKFESEKKYFEIEPDGKSLVVIHKCPKFKGINGNAYSVRVPRKAMLISCSECHYRFYEPIALPDENEKRAQTLLKTRNQSSEDPLAVLNIRLAKGEITVQEYNDIKKIIQT